MHDRISAYLGEHKNKLELLDTMWRDPRVQMYDDAILPSFTNPEYTVFLGGPTSRHQILEYLWRCEARHILRCYGFEGYIYVPEPRGHETSGDFTEKGYFHTWESSRLLSATHTLFWIPRNRDELLGLNTNLELGIQLGIRMSNGGDEENLFVGWPHDAEHMGLPRHYSQLAHLKTYANLEEMCKALVESL